MKKFRIKWKKVIAIIFGVLLSINIIGFLVNTLIFANELDQVEPYGQMIDLDGSKMHVYSMGSGDETIVLLPGWGIALPSADFGPLMRKLSEHYTVVTIEYFGVGFSDAIDTPRSNENYTNEIRTALDKAGFNAPYILMPHSASGIYAEYYATKHPEEVASIIMLDTTSTAEPTDTQAPSLIYSILKFQQTTGMTRINNMLLPETKLVDNGYSEQELADYRKFSNYATNDTIINQSELLIDNVVEVNALAFPASIPVLKLIAQETIDTMAKHNNNDGMEYQLEHLNRLGENASYVILDATHLLYQTEIDEIASLTRDFLAQ